jgi:1,4-alpha-glucan branching enzyme
MVKKADVKKIEFRVKAPSANWVGIAGDFNAWNPSSLTAKKDKVGIWKAVAEVSKGTHEYKFVIDGAWIADPSCSRRTVNSFGSENSVLVVK